jgi:hypothetical protein
MIEKIGVLVMAYTSIWTANGLMPREFTLGRGRMLTEEWLKRVSTMIQLARGRPPLVCRSRSISSH